MWPNKAATDADYERCARCWSRNAGDVRPAFASHNLRSLACARPRRAPAGLADDAVEVQVLYGMAEPLHAAVARPRLPHPRVRADGRLVPGMAYLVRRLLENTSNESFVRHRFTEGREVDALVARTATRRAAPSTAGASGGRRTDPDEPGRFVNEPPRRAAPRRDARRGSSPRSTRVERELGLPVPLLIDGARRHRRRSCRSIRADPT